MRVTSQQLQTLCRIAGAAGREIMAVYATDFAAQAKADASPLTEADLRADAVIRSGLEAAFPGVFILSEESSTVPMGQVGTFFLVDPLDGTKEFIKRNGEFTVNIALVHRGHVVAGVVFAPALDELYFAASGIGAFKHSAGVTKALAVSMYSEAEPLRVVGSRSHGADALQAWLAALPYEHSFVAAGSSLKFCRVACGDADIYPRLGSTSQWDTAAAQCVLEMAGGLVLDWAGNPLFYGLERSTLNPQFLAMGDPELKALQQVNICSNEKNKNSG